jgi:hypothetical protein
VMFLNPNINSIIGSLVKTIKSLETAAAFHTMQALRHETASVDAKEKAEDHTIEAVRANTIKTNLEGLISV